MTELQLPATGSTGYELVMDRADQSYRSPVIKMGRNSLASRWKSGLSHYTEMDLPGGINVRVRHDGKLSDQEIANIRQDVMTGRDDNRAAIALVSRLDDPGGAVYPGNTEKLNKNFGEFASHDLSRIKNYLTTISESYSNSKIRIDMYSAIPDKSSANVLRKRPTLSYGAVAEKMREPGDQKIRLSLGRKEYGRFDDPTVRAQLIANAVVISSTGLSNNGHTNITNTRSTFDGKVERLTDTPGRVGHLDAATYASFGRDARQLEQYGLETPKNNSAYLRDEWSDIRATVDRMDRAPTMSAVATAGPRGIRPREKAGRAPRGR